MKYRILFLLLVLMLIVSSALAQSSVQWPSGEWNGSEESLLDDVAIYGLSIEWTFTNITEPYMYIVNDDGTRLAGIALQIRENGNVQMTFSERRAMIGWLSEYADIQEGEATPEPANLVAIPNYFVATPSDLSYGQEFSPWGYSGSVSWSAARQEFSLGGGGWTDINANEGLSLLVIHEDEPYLVISPRSIISRDFAETLVAEVLEGTLRSDVMVLPQ